MNFRLVLTQLVHSFALVVAVLSFLDGDDSQSGVGELVGSREVRDCVMLVVGQDDVVLHPNDCRWWISFDVALDVHVVLESLTETGTRRGDDWRKFDLQIDVATITATYSVVSDAIICATIFLAHRCDFQNVSVVCASTLKTNEHKSGQRCDNVDNFVCVC